MFERVIAYEAWCDHDDCSQGTQMYLPVKFSTGRMAQARAEARDEGWWIGPNDEALCPKHKPTAAQGAG